MRLAPGSNDISQRDFLDLVLTCLAQTASPLLLQCVSHVPVGARAHWPLCACGLLPHGRLLSRDPRPFFARSHQTWVSEDKYWLEDHEKRLAGLDLDFKTLKARGLSNAATDREGVFKGLVFFRHESFPMKMEETKTVVECAGGTESSET